MDLYLAQEMGEVTLENFGLKIPFVISDKIWMLGYCQFHPVESRPIRIGLQKRFVINNCPSIVMDTILHECGHALVGVRQEPHDEIWKSKYLSIGGIGVEITDRILIGEYRFWSAKCWWCGRLNKVDKSINPDDSSVCGSCQSKIPVESWSEVAERDSVCDTPIGEFDISEITPTGRRLLEGALKHNKTKNL